MKKFRKIWLGIVIAMVLLFVGYRILETMKTDSSGPVISVEGEKLEVSIHDGEDILLEGITAADKKDGDVTSSVIVENISGFYGDNLRTVTYAAFDSDNHISKAQRELSYTDYTSPRFELTGSLRFRAGETVNIDQIVSASDCLDGDLSNKIKIRMDTAINNRVTGFYKIEYEVMNSAGDLTVLPIDIEIYEPYDNEVELNLDEYLVYYTGETIDYEAFLKSVRAGNLEYAFEGVTLTQPVITADAAEEPEDGEKVQESEEETGEDTDLRESQVTSGVIPRSRVRIDAQVDTSKPGVYPVYYYYTEEHENYTSEAKEILYVVVE